MASESENGAGCEVCGGRLPASKGPRGRKLQYCSTRCQTWAYRYPGRPMKPNPCEQCGEPLPSTRRNRRWCSRRCRTLAARKTPATQVCVVCKLEYPPVRFQQTTCLRLKCVRELKRRRSAAARRAAGVEPIEVVRERAQAAKAARLEKAAAAKATARRCVDCGGVVEGRRQWCEGCRLHRGAKGEGSRPGGTDSRGS